MKKISFRNDILPMKDMLFRLAMRITLSREEAEDIVQDTLIKVWNRRDSWDTIESVEAFSLTICRNLALDRMRLHDNQNASLDETTPQGGDNHADTASTPYEQTVQRERSSTLCLKSKDRACNCATLRAKLTKRLPPYST